MPEKIPGKYEIVDIHSKDAFARTCTVHIGDIVTLPAPLTESLYGEDWLHGIAINDRGSELYFVGVKLKRVS